MKRILFTESQLKRIMGEAIDELELYHGSRADFNQFDLAYLSTGWGQQAHGYGIYLTNDYETAKEYSIGGKIYTVEVPDSGYLNDRSITMSEKQKIANKLFRYFTEEDEERKLSYPDNDTKQCLWDYEIKSILNCNTGEDVYGTISSLMGDDKETSEFLRKLGYIGLKVTDERFKTTTYIIFNANDIKIIKKEKMV